MNDGRNENRTIRPEKRSARFRKGKKSLVIAVAVLVVLAAIGVIIAASKASTQDPDDDRAMRGQSGSSKNNSGRGASLEFDLDASMKETEEETAPETEVSSPEFFFFGSWVSAESRNENGQTTLILKRVSFNKDSQYFSNTRTYVENAPDGTPAEGFADGVWYYLRSSTSSQYARDYKAEMISEKEFRVTAVSENAFTVVLTDENSILIDGVKYVRDTGESDEKICHEFGISTKNSVPETPEFSADLSAYEEYMDPKNDLRDAFLLLVNKEHPIGSDYVPAELEYVPQKFCAYSGDYQARMTPYAAKAMTAMLTEAGEHGINDVKITLAYRSYAVENYLYNQYYNEEKALHPDWTHEQLCLQVETYKAPPGKGEHQTGLCADMHNLYNRPDSDINDFKYSEAYKWFKENCWKFGFILRFPEGREDITGYQFESWHYRFVGRYHAKRIYDQGITLEEYLIKNN